ncbi:MAG: MarR family transcriptional regulator [Bacteroidetes bacterium]|nr:MarR family transcriptional regulator [Bacteroidota bacterium]
MKLEEAIQTNHFRNASHRAVLNTLYSAWWLKTQLSGVLKPYGLTQEQYNVMRILKGKFPQSMCVKDIAGRMIEKGSNVPRIIDRLVAKKWVKRAVDQVDKRHTVIQLTESGMELLEKSTQEMNRVFDDLLGFTEKEAEQLNALLEKMRKKA